MELLLGDAHQVLSAMPDGSVDCVVTSPPFWGLRDYTVTGQYGLESCVEEYVDRLVAVFAQLRRVLKPSGTAWLNLGDCYTSPERHTTAYAPNSRKEQHASARLLPAKNLVGVPWRTAFALQADRWVLRNAVVWAKTNPMPESVRDRLSCTYELFFLLTPSSRYWFDLDPIRQPLKRPEAADGTLTIGGSRKGTSGGIGATARRRGTSKYGAGAVQARAGAPNLTPTGSRHTAAHPRGKNPGDVWPMATRPYRGAHVAPFPIDLPMRAIAAGCPPGGVVLDPFSGAATTGLAALRLGRRYIGIDINASFHDEAITRLTPHLDSQNRSNPHT
ncbi:DNA-methyltransferase [Pilimelia terevasa]|uniref:DNA-methyltransferase n=1 Tax=Pilimelia terevasa TaxID=53372 RepID=UPI0027E3F9E4|nr:site-specific DNA-methyltransferase [Pilimelia terevasa]